MAMNICHALENILMHYVRNAGKRRVPAAKAFILLPFHIQSSLLLCFMNLGTSEACESMPIRLISGNERVGA